MKRSVILSWLAAHGGQKDMHVDLVDVENPDYGKPAALTPGTGIPGAATGGTGVSPAVSAAIAQSRGGSTTEPRTVKRKLVTWISNDGERLRAFDDEPGDKQNLDADQNTYDQQGNPTDPNYEVYDQGKAPKDTNEPVQTPYQAAESAHSLQEAQDNAAATGKFETNAQRDARIRAEQDQQMQRDAAVRAEAQVLRQQGLDDRAAKAQAEANQLARDRLAQDATNSAASNEVARGNLAVSQEHLGLEQAAANKPQFLSTADPGNQNIAYFDPKTGKIVSEQNPNYDSVKAEGLRLQQELSLGIQLGNFDAQQAKTQYDQWFQQNVSVPFMAAQEARAQAADQRAAQQAEEQRNQFGADFGLRSAQFGQTAGQNAAQNQIALLPYRVGDNFGPDMSSAINSLAAGGKVDGPSPSAGIHFSPGDFTYQAPNLAKIAEKATAAALSHLTPYKPGSTAFTSAPSTPLPGPGTFANAPSGTSTMDPNGLKGLYSQLLGTYKPAVPAAAPPADAAPPPPDDQSQAAP